MNQLDRVQSVHDFSGLNDLRQAAQKNEEGALRQAAQHFESIFMNMLMKSMRQAEDVLADENSPFNSQTTKFYRDMNDQQMSSDLSKSGALGLADIIVEQMSPAKGKYMPAETLRSDLFQGFTGENKTNTQAEPLAGLMIQADLDKKAVLELAQQKQQSLNKKPEDEQNEVITSQQTSQDVLFTDKQNFVDTLMPIAKKVAAAIGLPPAAMVAQAALETGWGQRMIKNEDGSNALNFFGIKADQRWQGNAATVDTSEFKFGQMMTEKATFRSYDNIEQGLSDYISFVKEQPRYESAVKTAEEPASYFNHLQQAGYATDPNYAKKIMSVLKDNVFNQLGGF